MTLTFCLQLVCFVYQCRQVVGEPLSSTVFVFSLILGMSIYCFVCSFVVSDTFPWSHSAVFSFFPCESARRCRPLRATGRYFIVCYSTGTRYKLCM